ncbi:MAG: hypothetical protein IPL02_12160 [Moraxellaceae bacterium]|nr:hypothetical protein [Moraxellaceae bacterium]
MRLVVMGLMGVLFFSGSVYAGQEWIVSDIARSKVNSENEYYLYLKKSGSEWDIIGFSTSNEKLSIGRMQELYQKRERPQEINSLSQFLNKNDGYERLIVNESQKTFYLSPNYIASNPALGYQPIVMSDDTKKHSCNVGWSNNRTGRIDWFEKTYTFCNSGFTKCESTTGNKIRAAVLGTMVLGLASNCQVVVDVEQVTKIPMKEFERQRVLWNVTFSEYNKVRKESEKNWKKLE